MKCDKCKTKDANFHSITNINGKVSEKHLCGDCAKQDKDFETNRERIFNDFMSDFKSSLSFFSPINSLGFDDFFEDNFFNVSPIKISREENKILEEKQKELDRKNQKQIELNKLDLQLKKAVIEERYEDAIVLRDKIKALKDAK